MSKNITESISEYQFEEKQALEESDSGTDEFHSSSDPAMADETDDRAAFLVGRTSRFGRAIKLSNKLLS